VLIVLRVVLAVLLLVAALAALAAIATVATLAAIATRRQRAIHVDVSSALSAAALLFVRLVVPPFALARRLQRPHQMVARRGLRSLEGLHDRLLRRRLRRCFCCLYSLCGRCRCGSCSGGGMVTPQQLAQLERQLSAAHEDEG
jgi:hypothetical protein